MENYRKAFYIILLLLFISFVISYDQYVDIEDLQAVNQSFQTKLNEQATKIIKLEKRINEINNVTVKATAYNAVVEQTDDNPNINACRKQPRIGRVAVSQDLFYKGWTCGKWIAIKGLGIFQIDDVMHERKTEQVDIIKETIPEALEFGVVENLNAVLLSNYEKM